MESRACPRMQLAEVISPCLDASCRSGYFQVLGLFIHPLSGSGVGGGLHVLLLQRELRFKLYIVFPQPPVTVNSVAPQKSRQKGIWTCSRPSPTPSPRPLLLRAGTLRPRKEAGSPKVTQVGGGKAGVEFRPPDRQSGTPSSGILI